MSKRRRSTPADDITALVARLPPWAGLALAVVAWLVLHRLAAQPPAALPLQQGQTGQLGAALTGMMFRAMAGVGQYVLPLLCLLGAGVSAYRRHTRQALIADVAANPAASALDGIT